MHKQQHVALFGLRTVQGQGEHTELHRGSIVRGGATPGVREPAPELLRSVPSAVHQTSSRYDKSNEGHAADDTSSYRYDDQDL